MLENEEFQGRYVQLPVEFVERLAVAAENHHMRLSQWVDLTTLNGVMAAIAAWLEHIERARTQPTPSAEPGDLLVKLKRAEFWTFTTHGWRELAPIELVAEQAYDVAAGHPEPEHVAGTPDFLVGPSEAVRAGWDERDVQPSQPRRFFGRSVVEDELDRMRKAGGSGVGYMPESATIPPPREFPPEIKRVLDELLVHSQTLDEIAQALVDGPDGGNSDPLYTAAGNAASFARALEYARKRLLAAATDALRPQGIS